MCLLHGLSLALAFPQRSCSICYCGLLKRAPSDRSTPFSSFPAPSLRTHHLDFFQQPPNWSSCVHVCSPSSHPHTPYQADVSNSLICSWLSPAADSPRAPHCSWNNTGAPSVGLWSFLIGSLATFLISLLPYPGFLTSAQPLASHPHWALLGMPSPCSPFQQLGQASTLSDTFLPTLPLSVTWT